MPAVRAAVVIDEAQAPDSRHDVTLQQPKIRGHFDDVSLLAGMRGCENSKGVPPFTNFVKVLYLVRNEVERHHTLSLKRFARG